VYAAAIAVLTIFYAITTQPPLAPVALLAFVLLSLVLVALYAVAMPWAIQMMRRHGLTFLVLMFGLVAAMVFALALLLRGRAELYFYLLIFDGYAGFVYYTGQRRWGITFVLSLMTLTGLSHFLVAGWPAAGRALLGDLPWFGLTATLSELMIRQWEHRERAEALTTELEQAHQQLQDYATQAEALAVAQERARLAHEIHDSVGHTLTALDVQMELLARLPAGQAEQRQRIVGQVRVLAKQGLADVRRAVQALRPTALETFSLSEAITALVISFEQTTQIPIVWQVEGEVMPLPPRLTIPLYRAAQEALTNVQHHASAAQQVTLQLRYAPEEVALLVENDGVAAPPQSPPQTGKRPTKQNGYGLRGLRERAQALGGEFHAGPGESGGFRVEMRLPTSA
jgi:signal transduction histidine kinase